MLVSTCQLTPIDLQPPGASAVTGDIPIELPVSPSSVDVDHELTVRSYFAVSCRWPTPFCSKANRSFHP